MLKKYILTGITLTAILTINSCGSDSQKADAQTTPQNDPYTNTSNATSETTVSFTAIDIDGVEHTSDEWIGKKPVIVNFWGTWCPPCRREVPDLVELYGEYKDKGIEIVGLAIKDTPDKVKAFAETYKMEWVMLLANPQVGQAYGIRSVPTSIFYDASGKEVQRLVGLQSRTTLKQAFESIL